MEHDPFGGANPARADLMLGGRFRLLTPIGTGGMAVVWQAWDTVLARAVAVKLLSGRYAGDPTSRARIQREAQAAAALAHPNIAQVYDYGESIADGRVLPYVVMELVRGDTLQQRLKGGPVSARFAMRLCAEVGAALAAAHAEGLVHRDIKPANVMIASTGAKVVDFGIAAAITKTGAGNDEVFGTPSYLAPERLTDDAVQPASDVFSLGVLLYRMLSGESPWTMDTTTQLLAAHIHIDPSPLQPASPVPDHIVDLCMRCLSRFPAERPSASEVARLLAHAAGLAVVEDETTADRALPAAMGAAAFTPDQDGTTGPSVLIRPPVPPPAQKRQKPRRLLLAGGFAVAALAMAGWALMPDGGRATPQSAPAAATSAAVAGVPPGSGGVSAPPSAPPSSAPPVKSTTRAGSTTTPAGGNGRATTKPPATGRTTTPPVVVTTTPTTDPPEPVQRTFTSTQGEITATCTAPSTARILSATATRPYKIKELVSGPATAPHVTFKGRGTLSTIVVTCSGGVPST